MKHVSQSESATERLAKDFAKKIKKPHKRAVVVGFVGDLGAGKTTFIKALARALGVKRHVTSPTFLIMKKFGRIHHIDAYRIKSKDLLKLGFKKIISDPKNIIFIEWADRVKRILPKNTIWLHFAHGEVENVRIISSK